MFILCMIVELDQMEQMDREEKKEENESASLSTMFECEQSNIFFFFL